MKSNYLLPNKFKIPGWFLLILGVILGIAVLIFDFELDILKMNTFSIYHSDALFSDKDGFFQIVEDNSIVDELASLFIITGGLLVGFSKEKIEDEFIYKLRKDSLVWAIILNYFVLMFAIVFIYGLTFFNILVYNMFTPLLFFIVRFNFLKSKV